jgi:energy-coupling factor transport system substrate-specific component
MATTETNAKPSAHARFPRRLVLGATASAVAGLLIYVIGLPSASLFGDPYVNLTVPVALFVALAGTAISSALEAHAPWRAVDIVVASVLGVVGGVVFWAFNLSYASIEAAVSFFPPLAALVVGVWLFPAVLGGLIIRKPGAAVYTELVAAIVSAFAGNQWGFSTVWYGLVEGMGAEVVFALLLYRAFGLPAALAAGAGAGLTVGLMDAAVVHPTFSLAWQLTCIGFSMVSGVVIAGLGSWLLARGLARTGALAALPSGRVAERV